MRLTASKVITWTDAAAPGGVTPKNVYLGPDPYGLGGFQVAVATAATPPSRLALHALFTARKGKTQIQLVVALIHDGTVHLFGPDPQAQPVEIPLEQAERQLQSVLSEPDVLAATERFAGFRKANDSTGVAGFANSGLFASHHITKPELIGANDLDGHAVMGHDGAAQYGVPVDEVAQRPIQGKSVKRPAQPEVNREHV